MSRELKLRNKETGEIRKAEAREDGIYLYDETLTKQWWKYDLALLAKFWEFYKEPSTIKDVWFNSVIADGHIVEIDYISDEEALKGVERLKAWKRLKDTIIRIDRASFDYAGTATLFIRYEEEDYKKVNKDLDLLFGGEE